MGLSREEIQKRNIKILADIYKNKSITKIAAKYGITRARVYQILKGVNYAT